VPEEIADEHSLARHVYAPAMAEANGDLRWNSVFMFERDKGARESLVWMKHVPTMAGVHQLGCDRQRSDHAKDKKTTYLGALTSTAGAIRKLRSKKGAGFVVVHAPDEGVHHVEIEFASEPKADKNDRTELKILLREQAFGPIDPHVCPEAA